MNIKFKYLNIYISRKRKEDYFIDIQLTAHNGSSIKKYTLGKINRGCILKISNS